MRRSNGWRARWFAPLAASVTATSVAACGYPRAPSREAREPDIRVGLLVGVEEVTIGGQGDVAAVANGDLGVRIQADRPSAIVPAGLGIQVRGRGSEGRYERLTFATLDPGQHVLVNGRPYRGTVEVFQKGGGLTVVNRVALEAYLRGVVAQEIGSRTADEIEALRAQAVVSRTYALSNRGRFASEGFDVRGSVSDQAYGGVDAEMPRGSEAVRSTAGRVVTYRRRLIAPFFHSTCGFTTASPEEVFHSVAARPYLRSVTDKKRGGYYCDISPHFRWRVEWDAATLRNILRQSVRATLGVAPEKLDEVRDVRVARTGESGRATEVRVRMAGGEIAVPGPEIRSVFRRPDGQALSSTAVQISTKRDGDRGLIFTAAGAGWGHGVGMCQWGAVGRARAGQSYNTIVTKYFPGTRIDRWY